MREGEILCMSSGWKAIDDRSCQIIRRQTSRVSWGVLRSARGQVSIENNRHHGAPKNARKKGVHGYDRLDIKYFTEIGVPNGMYYVYTGKVLFYFTRLIQMSCS